MRLNEKASRPGRCEQAAVTYRCKGRGGSYAVFLRRVPHSPPESAASDAHGVQAKPPPPFLVHSTTVDDHHGEQEVDDAGRPMMMTRGGQAC